MEHLPFFLMTALAALGFVLITRIERKLYEERFQRQAQQERDIALRRMLFRLWSKYALDTEDRFIDKNEMLSQLVAPLTVLGCHNFPEKEKMKEESLTTDH